METPLQVNELVIPAKAAERKTLHGWFAILIATAACFFTGTLGYAQKKCDLCNDCDMDHFRSVATEISYPDTEQCCDFSNQLAAMSSPRTLDNYEQAKFYDISLQEAIQTSLQNSQVLRDVGGLVLRSPDNVNTIHSPAIQETDPRSGVERALMHLMRPG